MMRLLASLDSDFSFSHYFMFKRYHSQKEVECATVSKNMSHFGSKIKNNHNRNPKIHGTNFKEIISSIYKMKNFDCHRDINIFTNRKKWMIKTYNYSKSTLIFTTLSQHIFYMTKE